LEALVARRIGPDAFQRRFLEAWRAERAARAPVSPAIEALAELVEAYDPDFESRAANSPDEAELEQAARRALRELAEEGAPARTFDRARAREELRRFQFQMRQVVGYGCLIAFAWLALCALQVFAVSDQIQSVLGWPAVGATIVGFVLAFVPFIGNALAFFGAKDVWAWPAWLAAIVFFAAPAATLLSDWARWGRRP
jgi:hypothetical protein